VLFNSGVFLFVFLPITYLVFWSLRSARPRYIWLAATGYVFYGYWNPKFCLLMLFSTVVSYTAGLGFRRYSAPRARRWLLVVPITVDLSLLGFFKYADFAVGTVNAALAWTGAQPLSPFHVLLPVGISFYTFHTITYIVDCYRGHVEPTADFFEFACYVSLFSQLVAGPIVRFRELQEDLEQIGTKDRREHFHRGWSFFAIGLFQKVLIADSIAAVIDPALAHAAALSTAGAWMAMLGYAYQIYFDFAGYSNMAVGLGFLFGMHIPRNFNSPYRALNPSDFWRRWHISLSRCLKDYLYIPLGGSRYGEWNTYRNLTITMLLGGLWHGAAWTFVAWGGYHGLLLAAYRRWGRWWDRLPVVVQRGGMFVLVIFGWVLFRAPSWPVAMELFGHMLWPQGGAAMAGGAALAVLLVVAAVVAHAGRNTFEMPHAWSPVEAAGFAVLLVACLVALDGGRVSPFLYFQF